MLPNPAIGCQSTKPTCTSATTAGGLLGWRKNVTGVLIRRTFILSPFPPSGFGDSLMQFTFAIRQRLIGAVFPAITSSFAFDFIARQKLGGNNMNFFVVKQLPFLDPDLIGAHMFCYRTAGA